MANILADISLRLRANAAELQKGLDAAKNQIKDFKTSVSNSAKEMSSNFKGAFNGMSNTLDQMTGGLSGVASSAASMIKGMITGFKSLQVALISTGIGAIVVALGLAFASLMSYINGTSEGSMRLKEKLAAISGVVTALMNRVKYLGKALFDLLTGDVEGFKKGIQEAFKSGFFEEAKKASEENVAIAKEQNEIQRQKNKLREEELAAETEIARLQTIIRNRDQDTKEDLEARTNALKRLRAIDEQFDTKREAILVKEVEIQKKLLAMKGDMYSQTDLDNLYNAEKALSDFRIANYQEEQGQNKDAFRLQKEANKEEKEALAERKKDYQELQKDLSGLINLKYQLGGKQVGISDIEIPKMELDEKGISRQETLWANMLANLKAGAEQGKQIVIDFSDTVKNGIMSLTESVTESFANIITGKAGAGFEQLFKGILSVVGQFLKQMGAAVVAYAITMQAFKKAFTNPFAAIAAGLALMVMGGIVSNLANSIGERTKEYAQGGIVPGSSFFGDNVNARVNSGEMILNKGQQSRLFAIANGATTNGGQVKFVIEQDQLVGILENYNKKQIYF